MILYRPVSLQELELIYDSGMKAFPARLPKQPIFYPVLQLEYARKTASGWNAKSGQSAGYVTQFKVEEEYSGQFEIHTVGKSQHQELWIPAEEMEEFNKHILGHIQVVEAHFGDVFEGFVPQQFGLQGKNAVEQFTLLANSFLYKRMEFYLEIKRNHKAVFLNYPFWQSYTFKNPGLKEKVLQAIKEAWFSSFPKIPLPPPVHEETLPLQQKYPREPQLVNLDQEEITDVEPTDLQVQDLEKSIQKEIPSVKEKASQSQHFVRPVRQHVPPVNPATAPAPPLVPPIKEELTPITQTRASSDDIDDDITSEETDEDLLDEDIQEDTMTGKQTPTHRWINLVDEDVTSEEQTDEDFLDEDLQDNITPVQQTHTLIEDVDDDLTSEEETEEDLFEETVQEESPPLQRPYAYSSVNPARPEAALPKQTDSQFVQGIKLGLSGKYPEAIVELSRAVEENPRHVAARTSLGVAFHRVGENDRAIACYESALKIDAKDAEAHYFRANILYEHGDVREAIAGYTRAIGLKPELIDARETPAPQDRLTDYTPTPAEMYWIAKPARRILGLNRSLETNSKQPNLLRERAAAYERLRNYEQAIADYSSSLALQPEDAETFHARGAAYEQIGQHERALADYQRAIAIDPQLSEVYIQRGVTFGNMGNLRQSIASLTEGIRLAPKNPDGYFNRGTAYFQQGDFESAINDFSNVIRLSPTDDASYYWRGVSHEEAGRQSEAIADYMQFLNLSEDPYARAEIEKRLRQWKGEKGKGVSNPDVAPDDRQETNQVPVQESEQELDLYALIVALGERALNSTWFGSGVECYGEHAEELLALTDQNRPIEGQGFLRITSGIRQTIQGDFHAFDPGAASHWIFIRAWEGSGFYIETNDLHMGRHLRTHFRAVEEIEGVQPPYQAIFIPLDQA